MADGVDGPDSQACHTEFRRGSTAVADRGQQAIWPLGSFRRRDNVAERAADDGLARRGAMNRFLMLTFACLALAGCARSSSPTPVSIWQVRMMPRDSGKVYTGIAHGDGSGGGSVDIDIEGRTYSGPVVRTASNETFGFSQVYGGAGTGVFGASQSFGGTVFVKAILSSQDSRGLRCDLSGDGRGHLGGICVDDQKRVYDIVASR